MNLASWPDQALNALNATAAIIGLVAAVVVLICLGLMYLSGTELKGRILAKTQTSGNSVLPMPARARANGEVKTVPATSEPGASRVSQLEKELTAARRAEEAKTSKVSQLQDKLTDTQRADEAKARRLTELETEVVNLRRLEEAKKSRLSELDAKVTDAQRAEQAKASRLTQLETELAEARNAAEEKTSRLSDLEGQLKTARQSTDQAQAETKRVETSQGPRRLTPQQRTQFLDSVRGLPTGKIIISAFFENKETHEFGAEILGLFKEAGFPVIERTPVNFFTTSRPSSGIRIGCADINNAPPQFATVRKGLEALGIDAPLTSIVNAEATDVVEIQITPRQ